MSYNNETLSEKLLLKPKISSLPENVRGKVYSILGITEADDEDVRIVDEENVGSFDLLLFHYVKATPRTQDIRGVVLAVDAIRGIVEVKCSSFPHTEEIPLKEVKANKEKYAALLTSTTEATIAYEGTILRIFHYQDEPLLPNSRWFFPTHKKLDGTSSRWAGPSFGAMLEQAWPDYKKHLEEGLLNKRKCYVFLVAHPDNKLVCDIEKPIVRLVGVYAFPQLVGVYAVPDDDTSTKMRRCPVETAFPENMILPFEIAKPFPVKTLDDVIKTVEDLKLKDSCGVLLSNVVTNTCIKIVPDDYHVQREVRGNEPNLRLRYLELRKQGRLKEIHDLFPEKKTFFNTIENDIEDVHKYLIDCYNRKYRQRSFVRLPPEDYYIITATSKNYDTKLSLLENIKAQVATSNPRQLNAMINHMKGR
jgi:hypothetical protein